MTFRIRLSTPKSREIIEIPETWTLGTLKLEAGKRCKPKIKVKKNILLLTGYPPAPLDEKHHPDTQLARECLQPNDTIVVRVLDSKSKAKEQKAVENGVQSGASAAKKRSAAHTTSSTFATNKHNSNNDPSNHNHTNKKQISSTSNRAGSRKMARTGGEGRTLSGKIIAPPPSRISKKPSAATNNRSAFQMSSQDDVASQLLHSLNGSGNGGGKVGRFLRGAMRGAVGKSYEASRAQVRVAAVASQKFEFQPHPNVAAATTTTDTVQKIQVQYSKGLEGRGNYTEDVDLISLEALKAVITSVYKSDDDEDAAEKDQQKHNKEEDSNNNNNDSGREMLRPVHMAQLSPRVFWSLAYHCPQSSDTIAALNALLPDLDWRYLAAGRSKTLSEKARENLRQERVRKGEIPDEYANVRNKDGFDAGASVVAAVEEAMMESHLKLIHGGSSGNEGSFSVRDRMAKAALARAGAATENTEGEQITMTTCTDEATLKDDEEDKNWRLVTPDETDLDELIECITSITESSSASSSSTTSADVSMKIARHLAESCDIHNWRELANADASDLASKLSSSLSSQIHLHAVKEEEIMDQWIEQAQNRSMDEIMMEILDHREDVVIALRDEAKCGTPKDLSLWEAIPGVLLDAAPSLTNASASASGCSVAVVSEEELRRYCARARCILDGQEELGWLEWFVTGIS